MSAKTKERRLADEPKWFGLAGHFICGQWCRFHLATQVGQYWISTVGLYVHPRHSKGSEQLERDYLIKNPDGEDIGLGRKYETMVFNIDGDRVCECGCGIPKFIPTEIDGDGYNTVADAQNGHVAMVRKYIKLVETKPKRRAKSARAERDVR